jgi:hypothetical protein
VLVEFLETSTSKTKKKTIPRKKEQTPEQKLLKMPNFFYNESFGVK